ncbi:MAG: YciI family protein [Myxococcales bacterium]
MKFMVMHKTTPDIEAGIMPPESLIKEVGQLVGKAREEGRLVDGAGLRPSSTRVRVTFKDGKRTVKHGPYKGDNELIAGFSMLKVNSMDEAIEVAEHFAKIVGDVEIEIGPVTEPWDLGMMPKPADAPLRVLAMHKADKKSEAGVPPSPQLMENMGKLIEQMVKSGVFLGGQGLAPSAKSTRILSKEGKHTVIDGPFAESKELVSGYMIMEFDTKAEAVAFGERYIDVVHATEVDVREVM